MPKRRFSESKVLSILKEADAGAEVPALARRYGVAEQTIRNWKSRYGGLDEGGIRQMRQLQDENARLKRVVAQQALDIQALKEVLGKDL